MPKLFMLLIGCTPPGRHIEQHDVFFGIGETLRDLVPQMISFWPGENRLHLDAWRAITCVNGYKVEVVPREPGQQGSPVKLFFINLGGYKQNEFEEFHYKMVIAAPGKAEAIGIAKQTAFFRHTGFEGANSHVDDKYGVDVDDVYEITDILPRETKEQYRLVVSDGDSAVEDELHLGYFKLSML
ncbi:MAG TPA: DUF1543 domain-containing protein [Chitinophagaceae bacterium]|nr:DUF1543 domain-containing protein [Chitinophagaceae bacterium]